jgi:DNA-binding transcriptional ArsR family regulator
VSEPASADRAGAVFGALSDPTRRLLLSAIAEQPAATATQLASQLPISRQAVLKHLNALTDAGLLDRTRSGREVRYRFTPAPLSDAVEWMAQVGAEWDARLAVLGRQLGPEAPPGRQVRPRAPGGGRRGGGDPR